jgi:hypothetical protein
MAPVIDLYLEALAAAPAAHLELLARRGAAIIFAPTIPHALDSERAATRRGRKLTARERLDNRRAFSPESKTVAVYDPEIDALILPTSYTIEDRERVVLHELGHALTMKRATDKPSLLRGLSRDIAAHVFSEPYRGRDDAETRLQRIYEVLAESYVYWLSDREGEISADVMSELIFILNSVEEDKVVRFDFDQRSGRTRSRVAASRLILPGDPGVGELLASRPPDNTQLEERSLASDAESGSQEDSEAA